MKVEDDTHGGQFKAEDDLVVALHQHILMSGRVLERMQFAAIVFHKHYRRHVHEIGRIVPDLETAAEYQRLHSRYSLQWRPHMRAALPIQRLQVHQFVIIVSELPPHNHMRDIDSIPVSEQLICHFPAFPSLYLDVTRHFVYLHLPRKLASPVLIHSIYHCIGVYQLLLLRLMHTQNLLVLV